MDRRVLFASLILFAGGAAGVGVAVFAFVGLDDTTADVEILWQSEPADGDDGSGAVVATVDGDPLIVQSATVDDSGAIRAIDADGDVAWTSPLPGGIDPGEASGLSTGTIDGDPVVAFTTTAGDLVVLTASDGEEQFSTRIADGSAFEPAVTDLTGDGDSEFVVLDDDGTLLAVDAGGDVLFETTVDGDAALEPLPVVVEDTDATESDDDADATESDDDADATESDDETDPAGGAELGGAGVAVLTEDADGQIVSAVDADGDVAWSERSDGTTLSWNAADSRRGGIVALGSADGTLTTLEVADGSLRYEIGLQDVPVDVGGQTAGRIHVGGVGDVWAVDLLDGEVVWKQQYGGDTRVNAPTTTDLTNDGSVETVAVNRDGGVLAMNRNGEAVVRGDVGEVVVYASPLTADVTGDGQEEILVVDEDGRVTVLAAL